MSNAGWLFNILASCCSMLIGIIALFLLPVTPWPWRWLSLLIALVTISGGLFGLLATLYSPPGSIKVANPYFSYINLSQNLNDAPAGGAGLFWITYQSSYGNTASPIAVLLNVALTNTTQVPQTIKTYQVAIKTDDCGWINLIPIPVNTGRVWFTYDGLNDAKLFDFSNNSLDTILQSPISANGTVTGWWFFDSATQCNVLPGSNVQYRFTLTTYSGIEASEITSISTINSTIPTAPTIGSIQQASLVVPPGKPQADISGYYKKLYSAPIQ
jgi:hypothetical protein